MLKSRIIRRFAGLLVASFLIGGCAHLDMEEPLILDGDVAFEFGKAELTPRGAQQIDMYVATLANSGEIRLEVLGHTDRIGSDSVNNQLSKARAQTVKDRLTKDDKLKPEHIRVRGMGSKDPIVYCDQTDRQALIDCLAPNRRVEIKVVGTIYR